MILLLRFLLSFSFNGEDAQILAIVAYHISKQLKIIKTSLGVWTFGKKHDLSSLTATITSQFHSFQGGSIPFFLDHT